MGGATAAAEGTGVRIERLTTAVSDDPGSVVQPAIADYLAEHPKTDAIICASSNACMAATAAAENAGHTIGDGLDIIGKEAIPFLKQFRAPILRMFEDVARAGDFVARAAINRIENPTAPPMQKLERPTRFT